jgi:hypothetical protein
MEECKQVHLAVGGTESANRFSGVEGKLNDEQLGMQLDQRHSTAAANTSQQFTRYWFSLRNAEGVR